MKKIEMSQDKYKLYLELKKLVKRANQRMLALERETGVKEPFRAKELLDQLSSSPLMAKTKSSRISLRKDYTLMQMDAIKKATETFLSNKKYSTIKGVREYIKEFSEKVGKKVDYEYINTYYQVTHDFEWLYDESLTPSIFWGTTKNPNGFAGEVKRKSKGQWIELILEYKQKTSDRNLRSNLEMLYDYLKNG